MVTNANTNGSTGVTATAVANLSAPKPMEMNKKTISETVNLIVTSAKQAEQGSWKMMNLIRACDSIGHFIGHCAMAEAQAMNDEKVDTLKELAEKYGSQQLSYVSIKSNYQSVLKGANPKTLGEMAALLAKTNQAYLDHMHKHHGTEAEWKTAHKNPEGFLNPWSERYADAGNGKTVERGSTKWSRDVREAKANGVKLAAMEKTLKAQADKVAKATETASAAASAANASSTTVQAMASGGGMSPGQVLPNVDIPASYTEAVSSIQRMVVNAAGNSKASKAEVTRILNKCFADLSTYIRSLEAKPVDNSARRPSRGAAESAIAKRVAADTANLPDLTEEDKKNIAAVEVNGERKSA